VHVTVKLVPEVGSLRKRKFIASMREAFRAGKVKDGFRICQFSIQRDHMHVMTEAESNQALSRGVQGWEIRVARRVNARLGRKGKVFADRFHAVPVRSPRQLRNTLCYVLNNGHRHARRSGTGSIRSRQPGTSTVGRTTGGDVGSPRRRGRRQWRRRRAGS
jgi:REP element-mobilizing transposase RayT